MNVVFIRRMVSRVCLSRVCLRMTSQFELILFVLHGREQRGFTAIAASPCYNGLWQLDIGARE